MTNDIAKIEPLELSFESISKANETTYWFAHDLAKFLEYSDFDSFNKNVIKKARIASDQFGIDSDEEFSLYINNDGFKTYKLTRFACFLCCLVADIKEPKVALAKFADSINHLSIETNINQVTKEIKSVKQKMIKHDKVKKKN